MCQAFVSRAHVQRALGSLPLGTARFVWNACGAVVPLVLLVTSFACFAYVALFIWLVREHRGRPSQHNTVKKQVQEIFLFLFPSLVFVLACLGPLTWKKTKTKSKLFHHHHQCFYHLCLRALTPGMVVCVRA